MRRGIHPDSVCLTTSPRSCSCCDRRTLWLDVVVFDSIVCMAVVVAAGAAPRLNQSKRHCSLLLFTALYCSLLLFTAVYCSFLLFTAPYCILLLLLSTSWPLLRCLLWWLCLGEAVCQWGIVACLNPCAVTQLYVQHVASCHSGRRRRRIGAAAAADAMTSWGTVCRVSTLGCSRSSVTCP